MLEKNENKAEIHYHTRQHSENIVLNTLKKDHGPDIETWKKIEKLIDKLTGVVRVINAKDCLIVEKHHKKDKTELLKEIEDLLNKNFPNFPLHLPKQKEKEK